MALIPPIPMIVGMAKRALLIGLWLVAGYVVGRISGFALGAPDLLTMAGTVAGGAVGYWSATRYGPAVAARPSTATEPRINETA
jgi:hypothetical protein